MQTVSRSTVKWRLVVCLPAVVSLYVALYSGDGRYYWPAMSAFVAAAAAQLVYTRFRSWVAASLVAPALGTLSGIGWQWASRGELQRPKGTTAAT